MSSTYPHASSTSIIANALTQAIVEQRLRPGAKLTEQKLAASFGVSRTLVRQALLQLAQQKLVTLEPARGAFVASPSVQEAREVFAVRRMLEGAMMRQLAAQITATQLRALRLHVKREQAALEGRNVQGRTELLGDFHVRMAEMLGNEVLAQMLRELISRCDLITLMYQSSSAAAHSHDEHSLIVQALARRDAELAARVLDEHLEHVEANLSLDAPRRTTRGRQAAGQDEVQAQVQAQAKGQEPVQG
ncbi:GntR family transcriptional regulator [Corticibacter populi]|uniref:GntR family transcriptional regulator n=1 Tax=Corticibacter populi TaxID=1550736 RepID=A0A3M6R067_9BURK|nr:GntR family transcriptional regulator [Corticibacter populi]RMX08601.1 GntR family transcriptional regulator [Corticibacter populi]RZS35929.1 DNA-binding GntR family transcriptional regulator [Corticibacter populi]